MERTMCLDQVCVDWLLVGSAAVRLGTDKAFVLKLADWCKVEDHEGVRGSLLFF